MQDVNCKNKQEIESKSKRINIKKIMKYEDQKSKEKEIGSKKMKRISREE